MSETYFDETDLQVYYRIHRERRQALREDYERGKDVGELWAERQPRWCAEGATFAGNMLCCYPDILASIGVGNAWKLLGIDPENDEFFARYRENLDGGKPLSEEQRKWHPKAKEFAPFFVGFVEGALEFLDE